MNTPEPANPGSPGKSVGVRLAVRLLVLLLLLVIGAMAFYAVADWRGRLAWNQYQEKLQVVRALYPPASRPRSEARVKAELDVAQQLKPAYLKFKAYHDLLTRGNEAPLADLTVWARHFALQAGETNVAARFQPGETNAGLHKAAAAVVLEVLQAQDPFIEQVRQACRRPDLLYPFGYTREPKAGDFDTERAFAPALETASHLELKLAAELALSRTGPALEDLDLLLRLSDAVLAGARLSDAAVSSRIRGSALRPVGKALANRLFSEEELAQIQRQLAGRNLVAEFPGMLNAERDLGFGVLDGIRQTGRSEELVSGGIYDHTYLLPSGWLDREKLTLSRWYDDLILGGFSEARGRVNAAAVDRAWAPIAVEMNSRPGWKRLLRHSAFAGHLMSQTRDAAVVQAAAQVMTDHVRLACGLERFYLEHGRYPQALGEVAPSFIPEMPHDPLSGEPYRYSPGPSGRYTLWSVGWNGLDDGGHSEGAAEYLLVQRDWVWSY